MMIALAGTAAAQMPGAAVPRVQVEKATKGHDRIVRKSIGQTEAINSVGLHSAVEGHLAEVNFKEGTLVEKGTELMRIDPLRYEAALQQAEAQVQQLEAQIAYSQSRVNRLSSLASAQAASQEALETAHAALSTFRARKVAAEAELVRARKNLEDCTIRAEISGYIGRLKVSPGNYVRPGDELAVINQIDPIYVRFPLSQHDVNTIFRGPDKIGGMADVRIRTADGMNYHAQGDIKIVDNQLTASTDTYTLWAEFPNWEHQLTPHGISAVYLKLRDDAEVVMVPMTAVHHDSKGAYVYVVDAENTVSRRDIISGTVLGRLQAVYDGLQEGETVVTDGSHKTRVGGTVTPVFPEEKVAGTAKAVGRAAAGEPLKVDSAEVVLITDPTEITISGARVEAVNTVQLTPLVQGLLGEVPFKEGDSVKAGDVLFRIDPIHYRALVDVRKAEIAQLEITMKDAQSKYERQQFLLGKNASSKDEMESARATLNEAKARKAALEAALRVAEDDLSRCTITAPMDGHIGRTKASAGSYIADRSPLATLVQTSPIYVRFPMSETAILCAFGNDERILREARVSLVTASGKEYSETGHVAFCDNVIQRATDTQNIWATFQNANGELVPGGAVTVKLHRDPQFKIPGVPAEAILSDSGGKYVYVEKDGKAKKVPIVTGATDANGYTTVGNGLKPGQRVITSCLAELEEGDPVSLDSAK